MNGNFHGQILIEKLSKLNNSQQSIETLSHWCIFHRKNAKQVVETWERQFHCSPKDQRVSFLYLANDILQNSRWKGLEFVGEFWKVLPDALNDVLDNGDAFGRNAAMRLIDIWEDRKVFGSRGQTLKEELLGRKQEKHSRNEKTPNNKFKGSVTSAIQTLILDYAYIGDGPIDEDMVLNKCQDGVTYVDEKEKEIRHDLHLGNISGSSFMDELQEKHASLKECIQQLKAIEVSRAALVSHLRDALQEQETKLEVVRNQIQAAEARSIVAADISQSLMGSNNGQSPLAQRLKDASSSSIPGFQAGTVVKAKPPPVTYSDNVLHSEGGLNPEIGRKQIKDDHASDGKRLKLDNDMPRTPPHPPNTVPPPPPPPPYDDLVPQMTMPQPIFQQPTAMIPHPGRTMQGPPLQPPLQPPMQPPPLPTQFMQMTAPHNYVTAPLPQWMPALPPYPMVNVLPFPTPPPIPNQNAWRPENGGLPSQPSLPPTTPPISRQ